MAQWVKYLPCKPKNLRSHFSIHRKSVGSVALSLWYQHWRGREGILLTCWLASPEESVSSKFSESWRVSEDDTYTHMWIHTFQWTTWNFLIPCHLRESGLSVKELNVVKQSEKTRKMFPLTKVQEKLMMPCLEMSQTTQVVAMWTVYSSSARESYESKRATIKHCFPS